MLDFYSSELSFSDAETILVISWQDKIIPIIPILGNFKKMVDLNLISDKIRILFEHRILNLTLNEYSSILSLNYNTQTFPIIDKF